MKKLVQIILFAPALLISLMASSAEQTEAGWQLVIDEQDIKVQTRKVKGFEIIEVKGVTKIESTVAELFGQYACDGRFQVTGCLGRVLNL